MREDPRFGTDGVRGVANGDLSADFAFRLGRAAGVRFGALSPGAPVLLGRDTRRSGDLLRFALAAGLLSAGADVVDLGVIPTSGLAWAGRKCGAPAGVISASHNPAPDNGIKFFGPDGQKIADEVETELEQLAAEPDALPSPTGAGVGSWREGSELAAGYEDFLVSTCSGRLDGLRVVLDCGNGAAYRTAPRVLRRLGVQVTILADRPNGLNINAGCGALHPEIVQAATAAAGADVGASLDGDADRVILSDECGRLVDGDRILGICAAAWRDTERLPGNRVVGTVMSNLGLETGLAARGIQLYRAPVGDRNVAAAMQREGASLGGEKSGHVIFADLHSTGDGILTLLQVAALMRATGSSLGDLADQFEEYPQVLVNVPVYRRRGWREQPQLWEAVRSAESRLAGSGRVLVRASGTERILRVMAEGPDESMVRQVVNEIADVIRATMGQAP